MATALLVDGFGFSGFLPLAMGGELVAGKTAVQFPYNNYVSLDSNIIAAAHSLDAYIHNPLFTSPITIVAISMGCQVYWTWHYFHAATAPPGLSAVLLGNPERALNGACTVQANMWGVVMKSYSHSAFNPATAIPTIDFCRQYDGVADWPNINPAGNAKAVENAQAGVGAVHMDYFSVSLTAGTNLRTTVGNIEYVMSPTFPCPAAYGIASLDAGLRPGIETAYKRIFPPVQSNPVDPARPQTIPRPPCTGSGQVSATPPIRNADGRRYGTCPVCGRTVRTQIVGDAIIRHRI